MLYNQFPIEMEADDDGSAAGNEGLLVILGLRSCKFLNSIIASKIEYQYLSMN